jgi:hypothetical protein
MVAVKARTALCVGCSELETAAQVHKGTSTCNVLSMPQQSLWRLVAISHSEFVFGK